MKNKEKLLNNNNDNLIYKNNNNIRFKRMNRRLKGGWLVFALSTLSMVSVGFSTWVVTGPASGYGQVDVIADDVITILSNASSNGKYNFTQYGFTDENGEIMSNCSYYVNFEINQNAARESGYILSDNSTTIDFILSDANSSNSFLSLISNQFITISIAIEYNSTQSSFVTPTTSNKELKSTVNLSNMTTSDKEEASFVIKLVFNSNKLTEIKSYLDKLSSNVELGFTSTIRMVK